MTTTPQTPFERLRAVLLPRERLAVALSGGLDSSVLLAAAVRILGADHCLALTARTPYVMEEEVRDSTALCRRLGVRQEKLAFPILPALANNPPLRCYLCKHALFSSLAARAAEMGFPLLADGSNLDDLDDYRPGRKALQELGIPSPFLEAAMDKADIRRLAFRLGLPESVCGKPAYACLLTRLEHNRPVTEVLLRRVDAAESFLRTLGLKGCRVRAHGDSLARIELPEKERRLFWDGQLASTAARRLRELGFRHHHPGSGRIFQREHERTLMNDITSILHQFKKGLLSTEEAAEKIRAGTVPAPSHTDIDYSRLERTGCPEVIYGAGKTPGQIEEIARSLLAAGQNVLATRLSGEALDYLNRAFPTADMHPEAHLMRIAPNPVPRTAGFVGIVSAGTSDQYVAEEAALTAEFLGSRVVRYRDCGVAGLHRLVSHLDSIRQATALVAVAGMEGALPSVLAGLVKVPVIAVPTSVGYGANFRGVTTLLAMMNSCANGVSVVNIDNGFGAGFNAHLINSLASQPS